MILFGFHMKQRTDARKEIHHFDLVLFGRFQAGSFDSLAADGLGKVAAGAVIPAAAILTEVWIILKELKAYGFFGNDQFGKMMGIFA